MNKYDENLTLKRKTSKTKKIISHSNQDENFENFFHKGKKM